MEKRLQSLKLPRDLTLGGTKVPKKAYVPNLNAVRNKDKSKEFLKKTDAIKKENRHKKVNDRPQDNGRFIQSSGVFSEGAAAGSKRAYLFRGDRSQNGRDDTPVSMAVPTVNKGPWKVNKKEEESVFEDIMRRGFESDDDDQLPFTPIAWNESDLKDTRVPIHAKREIKSEITTVNGTEHTNGITETSAEGPLKKLKLEDSSSNTLPSEYADTETPSDHNPILTLWNLPLSFAAKGLSDDPNDKKISDYKLKNMLEGQIGKILVRKSGKTEVQIGNMKYTLEATRSSNEPVYSPEEIVTLEEKANGSLTSALLGEVQNKFMLIPDWQYLLSTDN